MPSVCRDVFIEFRLLAVPHVWDRARFPRNYGGIYECCSGDNKSRRSSGDVHRAGSKNQVRVRPTRTDHSLTSPAPAGLDALTCRKSNESLGPGHLTAGSYNPRDRAV